uniref:Uncharacterized protein n=1 Tax=Glossina brevipalpis TaxID=37001 RepID=A0A1A9WEJ5_9MUSC
MITGGADNLISVISIFGTGTIFIDFSIVNSWPSEFTIRLCKCLITLSALLPNGLPCHPSKSSIFGKYLPLNVLAITTVAKCKDSQTEPSADSPSPTRTYIL